MHQDLSDTNPPRRVGAAARPALIVIHGWGGSFADAVRLALGLDAFECAWHRGAYCLDRRLALPVRQILGMPDPDRLTRAFQLWILGRFLQAPAAAAASPSGTGARFDDESLLDEFSAFGLTADPALRHARGRQLEREARQVLDPLRPALEAALARIGDEPGGRLEETAARAALRDADAGGDAIAFLERLRAMQETGGDLDTVAAAVLRAHALIGEAAAAGRRLLYGRDYRFVFLNYHESLETLDCHGPADVYLADMPAAAVPEPAAALAALARAGVCLARFEDHHPVTPAQRAEFTRLADSGLIGFLDLGGPDTGAEVAAEEAACAAEMVYRRSVQGAPWDGEGPRSLAAAAHAEDFALGGNELGRRLTTLIKGGYSKLELAQSLLASLPGNDAAERVAGLAWRETEAAETARLEAILPLLAESVFVLRAEPAGGPPARILAALVPPHEPGQPRVTVGRLAAHYADAHPDAAYVFLCFGARLLVARRVRSDDWSVNLGALMPAIGSEGDGGHAGAAVCSPESNPAYPALLLPRVTSETFPRFVRYLASRIASGGCPVAGIEDRSRPAPRVMHGSALNLVRVVALAFAAGLLLLLFFPHFRPAAVRASNAAYFLDPEADDAAAEEP